MWFCRIILKFHSSTVRSLDFSKTSSKSRTYLEFEMVAAKLDKVAPQFLVQSKLPAYLHRRCAAASLFSVVVKVTSSLLLGGSCPRADHWGRNCCNPIHSLVLKPRGKCFLKFFVLNDCFYSIYMKPWLDCCFCYCHMLLFVDSMVKGAEFIDPRV